MCSAPWPARSRTLGARTGDRPLLSRLRRRTDAGHDLALGQVAVAHHPAPTVLGQQAGEVVEECGHLNLDRLREKRARPAARHLGQRIGKCPWLGKLQNVTVGHGLSLLRWRSGGSNTTTIRRLNSSRRHQLLRIALQTLLKIATQRIQQLTGLLYRAYLPGKGGLSYLSTILKSSRLYMCPRSVNSLGPF